MKIYPKVFIVVLNYNGKDCIKNCLASVFKADYPNFEVVVVDNASDDGSLELAKNNFSRAVFIRNSKNLGFSKGNNVGIRFALERMADYVLLLNNDTEVEENFLLKLLEVTEKEKNIGILSPVIFKGYAGKIWFSGGHINWIKMRVAHDNRTRTEEYYPSEFISGCCMLINKDVFKKIGLLDEDFFLYYEDADFSFRSKKAGFKNMVVASSWIYHLEKGTGNIKNKTYWLVISGLLFFKKNAPFYLKPWLGFYLISRKIKNSLDVIFRRSDLARMVKKAYKDFKHAKI